MASLHNIIKIMLLSIFLSTTTIYADDSVSKTISSVKKNPLLKTISVVKSGNGNIVQDLLEVVQNLGFKLGVQIKTYFKGNL